MTLYNAKSTDDPSTYLMTKFDDDLNLVDDSVYLTTETTCTCPAGVRPSCRHRQMLPSFLATARIDTPWFFDFDTGAWSQPFESLDDGEPQTPEAEALPELTGLQEEQILMGFHQPELVRELNDSATSPPAREPVARQAAPTKSLRRL